MKKIILFVLILISLNAYSQYDTIVYENYWNGIQVAVPPCGVLGCLVNHSQTFDTCTLKVERTLEKTVILVSKKNIVNSGAFTLEVYQELINGWQSGKYFDKNMVDITDKYYIWQTK